MHGSYTGKNKIIEDFQKLHPEIPKKLIEKKINNDLAFQTLGELYYYKNIFYDFD